MESTSGVSSSHLPAREPESKVQPYPAPSATYEDVITNPENFMSTLKKLHAAMQTKFMIPIIGGRELDLYKLFVEVTSRGGIEKVIREKRWKEVTAVFNFPSTATNASFVMRKYYFSLLYHYEQLYLFKARGWISNYEAMQSPVTTPAKVQVQSVLPMCQLKSTTVHQPMINSAELFGANCASSAGTPIIGVIDGKFDSGYLVTVSIGSEKLRGVLYQAPENVMQQPLQNFNVAANSIPAGPCVTRRRRRKKSEIKKRDPAHPKPNRSGYNFFFADQHARLRPLNPGKDREISRMIGELWNKLNETDKSVYQEKAIKDKERYRIEMAEYREKLSIGEVVSDAVPLQERHPVPELNLMDVDIKVQEDEGGESLSREDATTGSTDSEVDKPGDLNMEASPDEAGDNAECSNMDMETSLKDDANQNEKGNHESNEDNTKNREPVGEGRIH